MIKLKEIKIVNIPPHPEYILYCDNCKSTNCHNCNGTLFGAVISDDKEALDKMSNDPEHVKRIG